MYDSLFFTFCPQFLINKFLWMTCQESRSVSKLQYHTVVRIPELFLKLKSVQITALLCGLPAILIQRKETTTVKRHTGFPLYCVMIWPVLLSKKNDRVYKIRVLARYYYVDFFPTLLQSSQVKVPGKIPSMSLLFESWVRCLGSCKFQIRLFITACVTR